MALKSQCFSHFEISKHTHMKICQFIVCMFFCFLTGVTLLVLIILIVNFSNVQHIRQMF